MKFQQLAKNQILSKNQIFQFFDLFSFLKFQTFLVFRVFLFFNILWNINNYQKNLNSIKKMTTLAQWYSSYLSRNIPGFKSLIVLFIFHHGTFLVIEISNFQVFKVFLFFNILWNFNNSRKMNFYQNLIFQFLELFSRFRIFQKIL